MDNRLSKSERLRSFGAIRRLFTEGRGGFVYPFRYVVYAEGAEEMRAEILFSTPKKFLKRANKRNTLRRRSKEAYRLNKLSLTETSRCQGKSIDIALIYSSKEVLPYKTIENAICKILDEVSKLC